MSDTVRWSSGQPRRQESRGGSDGANLADILERVLDKGIVIAGDIQVNLLDIELLTIKIRLVVASVDRAKEMGIDWWERDPTLSAGRSELEEENDELRERIAALEKVIGERAALPEAGRNGGSGRRARRRPAADAATESAESADSADGEAEDDLDDDVAEEQLAHREVADSDLDPDDEEDVDEDSDAGRDRAPAGRGSAASADEDTDEAPDDGDAEPEPRAPARRPARGDRSTTTRRRSAGRSSGTDRGGRGRPKER